MGKLARQNSVQEYDLGPEQVVGRSIGCQLRLLEPSVSGVHAQLRWCGRGWELRDLGSRNGTFVDGELLPPGKVCLLSKDCIVEFGHGGEAWRLVDGSGPAVRVVGLDDCSSMPLIDGIIAIPNSLTPVACIYQSGEQWTFECDGHTRLLHHNETFMCLDRPMRFECPFVLDHTPSSELRPCTLASVALTFDVSSDEEHVTMVVDCPSGERVLPERSCHYLALTLARQRLKDQYDGSAEPGWLEIDDLLRMLPEYQTKLHLNVDVHRLRRLVAAANITDAARIIERRTGQLRIGVARLRVRRGD